MEMVIGDLRYLVYKSCLFCNCSWILWIDEFGFYIKFLFMKFVFFEGCDKNFFFFENIMFDIIFVCCKKNEGIFCGFGVKLGFLLFLYIVKNFMVIFFFI